MASKSALARRQNDVMKLMMSSWEVEIADDGGSKTTLDFVVRNFRGPKDTPYEGGVFVLGVHLPDGYPFKSPSIGFRTRIFHPNIDERSGTVCLDVINQTWSPMYDLVNIFETFLPQLLTYGNAADPLNGEAAALMMREPERFRAKVKEYVQKYATPAAAAAGGGSGSSSSGGGASSTGFSPLMSSSRSPGLSGSGSGGMGLSGQPSLALGAPAPTSASSAPRDLPSSSSSSASRAGYRNSTATESTIGGADCSPRFGAFGATSSSSSSSSSSGGVVASSGGGSKRGTHGSGSGDDDEDDGEVSIGSGVSELSNI